MPEPKTRIRGSRITNEDEYRPEEVNQVSQINFESDTSVVGSKVKDILECGILVGKACRNRKQKFVSREGQIKRRTDRKK